MQLACNSRCIGVGVAFPARLSAHVGLGRPSVRWQVGWGWGPSSLDLCRAPDIGVKYLLGHYSLLRSACDARHVVSRGPKSACGLWRPDKRRHSCTTAYPNQQQHQGGHTRDKTMCLAAGWPVPTRRYFSEGELSFLYREVFEDRVYERHGVGGWVGWVAGWRSPEGILCARQ